MRSRIFVCLSTMALAACTSGSVGMSPDLPVGETVTSVARGAIAKHTDLRHSWISPELGKSKTPSLFVSDPGTADVYIYKLSNLKLIGTITGFSQPQGECSDSRGNVWIADTNARIIYELSHHGQLQNELSDKIGYPVGCAWDATTGNLAVMDLLGPGGGAGDVLIYPHAAGTPTVVANANQYYYNFGGYDGSGDLFFDGRDQYGNFMLSELARGAQTAETIDVSGGTIYFPEW